MTTHLPRRGAHATAQARLFGGAATAARVASRAIGSLWQELLGVLKTTSGYHADYCRALHVLRRVGPVTGEVLTDRAVRLYAQGFRGAAAGMRRPLREDVGDDPLADLLLPAFSLEQVLAWLAPLVRPADYALLGTDSDRRVPEQLAHEIALGMSQGKTQREIAVAIRPHLDGSRVRAARAARTFGLLAAHTGQRDAWKGLGSDLLGYEVVKTTVPDSRPWHIARAGRRYYFNPGPGQDGMSKCPHPPMEPDDPGERPAGAPKVAWNCLCSLVPILSD